MENKVISVIGFDLIFVAPLDVMEIYLHEIETKHHQLTKLSKLIL